jgi:hypothetical protein
MAAREMPRWSASCLNWASQASKLPVLRQLAGAAEAAPPASNVSASAIAVRRMVNVVLPMLAPPVDSIDPPPIYPRMG